MLETKLFHDVVRSRYSARAFLPDAVPDQTIHAVVEDARHAPSNCNSQPWQVHIVSGASRDALSKDLLAANADGKISPDFSFSLDAYEGVYRDRVSAQGAAYYDALGIPQHDVEARTAAARRNLEFFDAPHVALLFMPVFGDGVRLASDMGMFGQNFLLSLTARGLGGVPQTMLGFYADTIRQALGVSPDLKLLFGISFGRPDPAHPANNFRIGRAAFEETAIYHR